MSDICERADREAAKRMGEGKRFRIVERQSMLYVLHGDWYILQCPRSTRNEAVLPELVKRLNGRKR